MAQEALGPSKLDIHKYKIIIVGNNDGFVGATALTPITHLKEDQVSLLDNLKYAVEATNTVLESVPQGTQFYKSTSKVLNYLTAAQELASRADATTRTASVTLLQPTVPVPPMHLGIPAKKRKHAVSHTVTSADADADTPAPTQMDPDVKFVDQVPSHVASCKLHFWSNSNQLQWLIFDQALQPIRDQLNITFLSYLVSAHSQFEIGYKCNFFNR